MTTFISNEQQKKFSDRYYDGIKQQLRADPSQPLINFGTSQHSIHIFNKMVEYRNKYANGRQIGESLCVITDEDKLN